MQQPSPSEKVALSVIRWVGSTSSIAVHTALFVLCFALVYTGAVALDQMLLALTTVVSLEAIYLAIFIQMTVNLQATTIEEVERDIDEIQEDIDEMQEDVEEIAEDVDELQEDVEDIEEGDEADAMRKAEQRKMLADIQTMIKKLADDVEGLQSR